MNKSYSELIQIPTFEERFEYLKIGGSVGAHTFGSVRFLNQDFYRSDVWKQFRRDMILRDCGCDLAYPDREIFSRIIVVHHINPITKEMFYRNDRLLLHPENVICCSDNTHKAIHYGDANLLAKSPVFVTRRPNDTRLW